MEAWLVYHEILHLLIGIGAGYLLWKWLGDRRALVAAILTSMLIDLDHLFDYGISFWPHLSIGTITSGSYFRNNHIFILFHSWELSALLLVLGLFFRKRRWGIVCLGIGLAMALHMLMDKVWYGTPWGLYSLFLRWHHHFLIPALW